MWSLLQMKTIPLYNGVVTSALPGSEQADSINSSVPAGAEVPKKEENLNIHVFDNYSNIINNNNNNNNNINININNNEDKKDELKGVEGKKEEENNNKNNIQDENTYVHQGVAYHVTEKEKAILEKQKNILNAEQFEKLFRDFELAPKKK